MIYNLAIIGYGNVGIGFTDILQQKALHLKNDLNIDVNVVAICDIQKGSIYHPAGLDLKIVDSLIKDGQSLEKYPDASCGLSSIQTITETNANVIIELTLTNLETAEPALTHVQTALLNRKHVITSNKGPSVLHHRQLNKLATENKVQYKIEGTVMSGTPVINSAQKNLAGCTIRKICGILNGTTNYILSEMEKGNEYQDVLQKAINLGYAEADPSGDIEGWDAVAKVVIISNVLFDANVSPMEVTRKGITHISRQDAESALEEGFRWKLIGEIENLNDTIIASVKPQKLPLTDPLANVMGNSNAITFDTDLLGPVTIIGAGAGRTETGYSILIDLISIHEAQSN